MGDDLRMTDQPAVAGGGMQKIQGRVFDGCIDTLAEVHRDAGHGSGDCAAPWLTVQTMDVPAQQPLDLRMATNQSRQILSLLRTPVPAHIVRVYIEWRMVCMNSSVGLSGSLASVSSSQASRRAQNTPFLSPGTTESSATRRIGRSSIT